MERYRIIKTPSYIGAHSKHVYILSLITCIHQCPIQLKSIPCVKLCNSLSQTHNCPCFSGFWSWLKLYIMGMCLLLVLLILKPLLQLHVKVRTVHCHTFMFSQFILYFLYKVLKAIFILKWINFPPHYSYIWDCVCCIFK